VTLDRTWTYKEHLEKIASELKRWTTSWWSLPAHPRAHMPIQRACNQAFIGR